VSAAPPSPALRDRAPRSAPVVFYILHSGNLYGTERMALATLEGMDEYERRVVFSPFSPGHASVRQAAVSAGFEAVRFDSRWGLVKALVPWFFRYGAIDVIATGVVHSVVCHALSRTFGVRLRQLHVAHGGTADSFDRKHVLNRIPLVMVAVSEYVRQQLVQCGVHAEGITVIDNFLSSAQRGEYARRAAYDTAEGSARPLDRSRVKVAIVSRVDAIKKVDLLVEAAETFGLHEFQFDIFGTGDQFHQLRQRAESLPNLHFHGFVSDIKDRLAEADVLLHLCPQEPFGLVVLEAFLAGVVAIVADTGGVSTLVDDGVTGLKFKANDVADLYRVLQHARQMAPCELQALVDRATAQLDARYSEVEGVRRYRRALEDAGLRKRLRPVAL